MRIGLAIIGMLLYAPAAQAQLPLTGRAADECKAELKHRSRNYFFAWVSCIDGKLRADPSYNDPRPGKPCASSSAGGKC